MLTQTWWNKSFSQVNDQNICLWSEKLLTKLTRIHFLSLYFHWHRSIFITKKNPYYQVVKRFVSSHHDVKNRCKLGKMKSFPLGAKRIAKKLSSPLLFLSCFAERTERARHLAHRQRARAPKQNQLSWVLQTGKTSAEIFSWNVLSFVYV